MERHSRGERGKSSNQEQGGVLHVGVRGSFSEETCGRENFGGRTLEEMAAGTACAKALRQAASVLEEQQRGQHTWRVVRDEEMHKR